MVGGNYHYNTELKDYILEKNGKLYKGVEDRMGYCPSDDLCDKCKRRLDIDMGNYTGSGEFLVNNIIDFRNEIKDFISEYTEIEQLPDFEKFLERVSKYGFDIVYSSTKREIDIEYQTNYIRKQYYRLRARLCSKT